ncbi:MAG: FeoC-like transcriptional regulator [Candidatus Sedimenticola endophacoides]
MILGRIKAYLRQRGQATLADIALHVGSEPDAVLGMLETWIRKGEVRKYRLGSACGSGCGECPANATEIYQWLGEDRDPAPPPLICTSPGRHH